MSTVTHGVRTRGTVRRAVAAAFVATMVVVVNGCGGNDDNGTGPGAMPTSASATETQMVNLGDSYSAAAGVEPLVEGSPVMCLRSSRNFAHVVASAEYYQLTDVSCSGADTADLTTSQYDGVPAQLDALSADADVVTVMIGGNDSDLYTTAISACSQVAESDLQGAPCQTAHGSEYSDIVERRTSPALVKSFAAVREKAPKAKVLAIGYPWILPETGGCYPTMRIAAGDVAYLHELQATLNDAIRNAAERASATFVDMSDVSAGHDACAPVGQRWIEPQNGASGASPVHPNAAGQQGIADQIAGLLH